MSRISDVGARRDERVCSYVAVSYVLGHRHAVAPRTLGDAGIKTSALIAGLQHPERAKRARSLALALQPILKALESRRIA
jgi:hypothetical protein